MQGDVGRETRTTRAKGWPNASRPTTRKRLGNQPEMVGHHASLPASEDYRRRCIDQAPLSHACKTRTSILQVWYDTRPTTRGDVRAQHSTFTSRHNGIRDIIAKYLARGPNTEVWTEPGANEHRRNDIGLRGPGRTGRRNIDYDVKVYSMTNQKGTRAIQKQLKDSTITQNVVLRGDEEAHRHLLKAIDSWASEQAPGSQAEFRPLAFSTGGMMSPSVIWEMVMWEEKIGKEYIGWMQGDMSVSLLNSRTSMLRSSLLQGSRVEDPGPGVRTPAARRR
jgi:hypothetical protein